MDDIIYKSNTDVYNHEIHTPPNKNYIFDVRNYNDYKLDISTNHFATSNITGYFENIKTIYKTSSIIYKNTTFKDCYFMDNSWYDRNEFINCEFINCEFKGDMRWIKFKKCDFIDTLFDLDYIRATTFHKKCIAQNLNIKTNQIDEYIYLFGKRYGNIHGGININFKYIT